MFVYRVYGRFGLSIMSFHISNWNPLGANVFYRKICLTEMQWQEHGIDLCRFDVVVGAFAGSVGKLLSPLRIHLTFGSQLSLKRKYK